jgi:predicted nucleic acid-binding protein
MPTTKKKAIASSQSAFWDACALVPLCCQQSQTTAARQARRLFPVLVVWWATSIECSSALRRLERAQDLTPQETQQAFHELERLRLRWTEIAPLNEVRDTAERLLGIHGLRAADSLQLAAALVWCNGHPKGRAFISGDDKLLDAAEKEGFNVVRL